MTLEEYLKEILYNINEDREVILQKAIKNRLDKSVENYQRTVAKSISNIEDKEEYDVLKQLNKLKRKTTK